jgi:hypothetical protein
LLCNLIRCHGIPVARSKEEEVMSQALCLAERASRRLFLTSLALAESAS